MTEAAAAAAPASTTAATGTAAAAAAAPAATTPPTPATVTTAPVTTDPAAAGGAADPYAGLKAPEGFDPAAMPKIAEVAKAYGLDAKNAQKLLDDTHASSLKAKADMEAALAKQKAEWHASIKADKEYGGEKFQASLERAQKVVGEIDQKIAPGLKELLDASGYGEHPAVVRLFNYLGAQNREDSFATGNNNAAGEHPKTLTQLLYPTSTT